MKIRFCYFLFWMIKSINVSSKLVLSQIYFIWKKRILHRRAMLSVRLRVIRTLGRLILKLTTLKHVHTNLSRQNTRPKNFRIHSRAGPSKHEIRTHQTCWSHLKPIKEGDESAWVNLEASSRQIIDARIKSIQKTWQNSGKNFEEKAVKVDKFWEPNEQGRNSWRGDREQELRQKCKIGYSRERQKTIKTIEGKISHSKQQEEEPKKILVPRSRRTKKLRELRIG